MKNALVILMIVLPLFAGAQKQFSKDDLLAVVSSFHPVVKQAYLDVQLSGTTVLAAKALFDPVLSAGDEKKQWQGIQYYDQKFAKLTIPAWYGINVSAGSESIKGERINPEETKGSIQYLSVSVPLLQHFIIDKRKAMIQQSKLLMNETDANRKKIVNDIMYEALSAYWEWWEQYRLLEVIRSSSSAARQRFNLVRQACLLGERAAIDTVEAITQLQTLQQSEIEASMELGRKRLALSVYLWTKDNTAYELPEDVLPSAANTQQLSLDSLFTAVASHPEMEVYEYKLKYLAIERKLKFQSLVPAIDLVYNHTTNDLSQTFTGTWSNNYRIGVAVSIPLRLSEARAHYRAARLKMDQARLMQVNKLVLLQNKVKQYYLQWQQIDQQVALQNKMIVSFTALQKAEETRFFNGESSMFLVNARELKRLEALQKRIALEAKQQKTVAALEWSAGLLHR